MRHVVYLLLVVNLVFLGWNIFQSQSIRHERELPPIALTARPLVTLQERELAAAEGSSVIDTLTGNEPPGAGLVCQTLGPFMALDAMQTAADKLDSMELAPQQREATRRRPIGYWVYLPEMEDKEARRLTQILDDHSDKEYYLGRDNVLSLGAFKEMSRAKTRLARVRKLGIEPRLETRYRTETEYWLDIEVKPVAGGALAKLLAEDPDVWLQDRACY